MGARRVWRAATRREDGTLRRRRNERELGRDNARRRTVVYAGVDGEGVTDESGKHRYVLLQYSSRDGEYQASLEDVSGIGTVAALEFLLAIPLHVRTFAYAFNYDLTKFLADLPDELLYRLFRPETRKRPPGHPGGPVAVKWGPYRLNLLGTKFSVAKGKRRRVVWDVFRFYQKKFTRSLKDWQVCPDDVVKRIDEMKDKRESFTLSMLPQMRAYCFEECSYLATLVEKLDDAHERAGLVLKNYYGAGSTAGALLHRMGIKDVRRDAGEQTSDMREAVASAFFGGRFENSIVGVINGPIYNYDICSAYPYQLRFLPCLEHGTWRKTLHRADIETSRGALVSYTLHFDGRADSWGPFPFRTDSGSVVFPYESSGGWLWRDEYLAGERNFSGVTFLEAWVYDCDCDCAPFADIPSVYLQRLSLGKDGAGIVLKLGPNSVYGKLAQSVGSPQFQSWIWAGMVTSNTRAMLLDMLALAERREDVIAMATDSIVTQSRIAAPAPRDTGTSVLLDGTANSPSKLLGAWDCKTEDRPVFFARPGIFFPLNATEGDLESVRARGIGRKNLLSAGSRLVDAWRRGQLEDIDLGTIRRFCGAKTSTQAPTLQREAYARAETYGQWVDRPVVASLNPLPKREPDVERRGDYGVLKLRSMAGLRSEPYRRALSLEALELKAFADQAQEQPEGLFDVQVDALEDSLAD